ncbi:Pyridoxal-phosphate-dependent serine hydroxymethyltransferase [Vibrio nigripulchritudo SOn1]|uniref:Serine hydroxymethyltransferase n=1 Tax=Vibrio nigripulchritudo SOn1 TaxID=1238450 RepID=A0AAV2VZS5_9VIBR|nr:serine hydroxymethyltransferase [Vibrio nigripulchritudo]CCO50232.1 Pyridoxal-phosphate-dependent serine hydroxymethyltransferase [Vibrio nigripulchritudo SOn1]
MKRLTEINDFEDLMNIGISNLKVRDPEVTNILNAEVLRQNHTLSLVASCCAVNTESLVASASSLVNVTAEGTPGKRYHAGCKNVDLIESLAIDRARKLFDAEYAGVQSHSASSANYQVYSALLNPGDTLLGMALDFGGHLTHGSPVTFSGTTYKAIGYGTTLDGQIDYQEVEKLALEYQPKLIVCGATAYSRTVDFARFREIADMVGAILMADISHIAGLVVAGLHPSPINHAHITTTCTHKQLSGPRGGLILSGRDANKIVSGKDKTFSQLLDAAVFPKMQGAPAVNAIASKAVAFGYAMTPEFKQYMERIRSSANVIAQEFDKRGYEVVGQISENHTVLIRLSGEMTGAIAEEALEQCSILVNKNRVPGETRSSFVTSGLRIGTGSLSQRHFDSEGCERVVNLICNILESVEPLDQKNYYLDRKLIEKFSAESYRLCEKYPIKEYKI